MALAWKLYKLKFELKSLLVRMGGWVVDKTKIMLSQLQTEVELKSELSLAMSKHNKKLCSTVNS